MFCNALTTSLKPTCILALHDVKVFPSGMGCPILPSNFIKLLEKLYGPMHSLSSDSKITDTPDRVDQGWAATGSF